MKFWNKLIVGAAILASVFGASVSYAIDNPDAPDYLADFRARATPYETAVDENLSNPRAYAEASHRYDEFLDKELNAAYKALQSKLKAPQQAQLREAQKNWIKFRDSEFQFVDSNWIPEKFGSSSTLSRHDYHATLVRSRVEQLLMYLKNYGS